MATSRIYYVATKNLFIAFPKKSQTSGEVYIEKRLVLKLNSACFIELDEFFPVKLETVAIPAIFSQLFQHVTRDSLADYPYFSQPRQDKKEQFRVILSTLTKILPN